MLVLSGEMDPVTPPENGDRVSESLSNSQHIVATGQGHIISSLGCVPKLIGQFVNTIDPQAIDASCVDRLAANPFFVSSVGPTP